VPGVGWYSLLGIVYGQALGRYSFAPADGIAEGELRPLHQSDDHGDLAAGAAQRTFLFR
jgi:hypothetical protein